MERDELQEYLNALGRSDCYRIDAVLKDSVIERTERVFFVGSNGSEFGPFIRKIIANESGQGRIYEKLHRAQKAGKRFAHLPRVYECYSTDSSLVAVIEFVQGETLQQRLEREVAREQLTRQVFPALCDAVSELHEAFDPPIIHRDLTPANIIVSDDNVTLIDLGIARTFHPDAQRDTTYFGTRDYAPPEQFGFGQTDVRSDVYAIGKVLQYCLSRGEATHSADENEKQAREAAAGERAREAVVVMGSPIDPHLAAVIAKATQLDPVHRFQSAADLKEAFMCAAAKAALSAEALPDTQVPPSAQVTIAASYTSEQSALLPPPQGSPAAFHKPARYGDARQPTHYANGRQLASRVNIHQPAPHANVHQPIRHANIKGRGLEALFSRIPRPLGIVWDILLLMAWIVIVIASILLIVEPEGASAAYPLWFRVLEVIGIATIPFTAVFFYVLDLRLIRGHFPNVRILSRRKTWYFLPAFIIVCWILVMIVGSAAGFLQPAP